MRLGANAYADNADVAAAANGIIAATARGWAPRQALELGLDLSGTTAGGTSWSFEDGVYKADGGTAVAHVLFGVVHKKTTLSLSFRGTDDLTDVSEYPDFARHYAKFAPLVEAVEAYVANNGCVSGDAIDQVWVSGHSLGGAMAQMFLQGVGDTRYVGATFGSPGAALHAPDPRMLHFEHIYNAGEPTASMAARTWTSSTAGPVRMSTSAEAGGTPLCCAWVRRMGIRSPISRALAPLQATGSCSCASRTSLQARRQRDRRGRGNGARVVPDRLVR